MKDLPQTTPASNDAGGAVLGGSNAPIRLRFWGGSIAIEVGLWNLWVCMVFFLLAVLSSQQAREYGGLQYSVDGVACGMIDPENVDLFHVIDCAVMRKSEAVLREVSAAEPQVV